jgi:hypothetical protein
MQEIFCVSWYYFMCKYDCITKKNSFCHFAAPGANGLYELSNDSSFASSITGGTAAQQKWTGQWNCACHLIIQSYRLAPTQESAQSSLTIALVIEQGRFFTK